MSDNLPKQALFLDTEDSTQLHVTNDIEGAALYLSIEERNEDAWCLDVRLTLPEARRLLNVLKDMVSEP